MNEEPGTAFRNDRNGNARPSAGKSRNTHIRAQYIARGGIKARENENSRRSSDAPMWASCDILETRRGRLSMIEFSGTRSRGNSARIRVYEFRRSRVNLFLGELAATCDRELTLRWVFISMNLHGVRDPSIWRSYNSIMATLIDRNRMTRRNHSCGNHARGSLRKARY